MSLVLVETGGVGLQFAQVTAVIRSKGKADREVLLSTYEAEGHRAKREAQGLELPAPTYSEPKAPTLLRKLAGLVGLGALLLGAAHYYPDSIGPALAATVITNAGQAINTNLVSGLGGTVPKWVAWGTGAGTAAVTDTTLFTESTDEARTVGTPTRVTTTVTNDTLQIVGQITVVTANKTITNVGTFDALTSGNLHLKSDFTGLPLVIGDSITFTLKTKYA